MSWTDFVSCACLTSAPDWRVVDGVWTCQCGRQMTVPAIKAMHKVADGIQLSPAALAIIEREKREDEKVRHRVLASSPDQPSGQDH